MMTMTMTMTMMNLLLSRIPALLLFGLQLLSFLSPSISSEENASQKLPLVAVCITGQVMTWLPEQVLTGLVNANPDVEFALFVHLQFLNSHHNSSMFFGSEFEGSNLTSLSLRGSMHEISEMYTNDHTQLIEFKFQLPYHHHKWKHYMNTESLDRITQDAEHESFLLNSYRNQVSCAESVQVYEKRAEKTVDYIINMHEDVYFFEPMSLKPSFRELSKNSCSLISKGCSTNSGINTKLQIAKRDPGMKIFGSRLDFYRSMYETNSQQKSPETFEQFQLQENKLTNCALTVDEFPVTAARMNSGQRYCLVRKEVDTEDHMLGRYSCVPSGDVAKIQELLCDRYTISPPPSPASSR